MRENPIFSLSPSDFFSNIPTTSIWIAVFVIVIITIIYSIIFFYHWKKYSINSTTLPYFTVLVYTVGTLFLLFVIIGSAVTISL